MENQFLNRLISDADDMVKNIMSSALEFASSYEKMRLANDAMRAAKSAYDDAEHEVTYTIMFDNEQYHTAKNAETRKALLDRAIDQSRRTGSLAKSWRALQTATEYYERMQSDHIAADAHFKAIRVAGQLVDGSLRAATVDAYRISIKEG